ncbi:unnamed protein product [Medioppia subpectinata]|uniref:Uncharacterized protein n=1 Tax=Medioppia subpectinata TaxID=1979941 RepID=A0A7R9LYE3_9ACAR|nr:unnamed protein product [Medioppia subpectinata]CAG2122816.1 unnamed protein product [Medioppia subpectinata]
MCMYSTPRTGPESTFHSSSTRLQPIVAERVWEEILFAAEIPAIAKSRM